MTRLHLLQHLIHQARGNGFELRRWFRKDAALPWPGGEAALQWLCEGSRVHLLLFSHTFAQAFFGGPERLRHIEPATVFERTAPNGVKRTIHRRAYPRTARYDGVWRYHLQQMATAPDPLRYAQRFLVSAEMMRLVDVAPPAAPHIAQETAATDYDEEMMVREE